MNSGQNNLSQRQALIAALNSVQTQLGSLHAQINALADLEYQAAQAGSRSANYQARKDALIAASDTLIERAQLLHSQLCSLP